jgi:F0F1-type ATP synthase assembly protein I
MENKEGFRFTYSAQQQKEVEAIRKKYIPKEEDKMEQLRKLHAIPTQKAQAASLAVGIIGALIMGTGMSFAMTDIGAALGSLAMVIGIAIGIVGMVLVALAYPLYNRVLKKQREKIAPEILRLTDELLK